MHKPEQCDPLVPLERTEKPKKRLASDSASLTASKGLIDISVVGNRKRKKVEDFELELVVVKRTKQVKSFAKKKMALFKTCEKGKWKHMDLCSVEVCLALVILILLSQVS